MLKKNECNKEFYLKNGKLFSKNRFELPSRFTYCVYEVVRVTDGVALFLEDHLQRLFKSVQLLSISRKLNIQEISNSIITLINANKMAQGNIKCIIYVSSSGISFYAYYIRHSYPKKEIYKSGVMLKTTQIKRINPNIKLFNNHFNERAESERNNKNIFEILLVDNDYVTEGSRSNIFFIKGKSLFTPPGKYVLKGITRKKIIEIMKNAGIKLIQKRINLHELGNFDGAFLTGTSINVLPIKMIDNISYNISNNFVKGISKKYLDQVNQYIQSKKQKCKIHI
jgi:branched-chain amino acid aminotransferase